MSSILKEVLQQFFSIMYISGLGIMTVFENVEHMFDYLKKNPVISFFFMIGFLSYNFKMYIKAFCSKYINL